MKSVQSGCAGSAWSRLSRTARMSFAVQNAENAANYSLQNDDKRHSGGVACEIEEVRTTFNAGRRRKVSQRRTSQKSPAPFGERNSQCRGTTDAGSHGNGHS